MLTHEKIKILDLGLSEAKPLLAGMTLHRRPMESLYDMHYALELGIVLSGRMKREYDGHTRILKAGDVWFANAWEPHGGKIMSAPSKVLVFLAWPGLLHQARFGEAPAVDLLAPFLCHPQERPGPASAAQRVETLDIAGRGQRLLPLPEPERSLRLRYLLFDLLTLLQRGWAAPRRDPSLTPSSFKNLDRAISLVFESRRLVSKAEAAKACGLGRNAFDQAFQGLMGLPFKEFGLRFRVSQVAAALLVSDLPLKELAGEWGFVDASHLNRCFRRFYAMPAAQYRKERSRKMYQS